MIRFHFHPTPNPAKVALFLEEAGLPYEVVPVDTGKGEQHAAAFRAINPNGKVPAIVAASAIADAIVAGIEADAIEVVRAGEARAKMAKLNQDNPGAIDRRFLVIKAKLEEAVRNHVAL